MTFPTRTLISVSFAFFILFAPSPSQASVVAPNAELLSICQKSYDTCDFKFSGLDRVPIYQVTLGSTTPDVPFTPKIVKKNKLERIGVVNAQGTTPILTPTKFLAPLRRFFFLYFSKTQFKPKHTAIVHEPLIDPEAIRITKAGLCVVVRFSDYQVLDKMGNVKTNVKAQSSTPPKECVAFMAM